MPALELTWLGHSAFRFDTPEGGRVYVDPFLTGNPKTPEPEQRPERVDAILLTHGHDDHVGDTLALAQQFDCAVYAIVELRGRLAAKGLGSDPTQALNKGGTTHVLGVDVTLTDANHSSSEWEEGRFLYLGEPAGWVVDVPDGPTVYFAGDTNVFASMQLIGRIYEPDVAVLPIGDHFTMGPREAAVALELLGSSRCVPCHWGTFPLLTGTPAELRSLAPDVEVLTPEPGETIAL